MNTEEVGQQAGVDEVRMFVNGQAMSGGSISDALSDARFLGPVSTADKYEFYSVRDEFPGLHPVAEGGTSIPGELYALPYAMLRERLLPREPEELELGVIELADGSGSLSMRMRSDAFGADGVVDISDRGGWLKYLASKNES